MSNIVIKASKNPWNPRWFMKSSFFFPAVLEFISQKTKPHLLVFVWEKSVTISYSRSNSIQILLLYLSGILNKLHPQHWLPSPLIVRDFGLVLMESCSLNIAGSKLSFWAHFSRVVASFGNSHVSRLYCLMPYLSCISCRSSLTWSLHSW